MNSRDIDGNTEEGQVLFITVAKLSLNQKPFKMDSSLLAFIESTSNCAEILFALQLIMASDMRAQFLFSLCRNAGSQLREKCFRKTVRSQQ